MFFTRESQTAPEAIEASQNGQASTAVTAEQVNEHDPGALARVFSGALGESSSEGAAQFLGSSIFSNSVNGGQRVVSLKRAQQTHGNRFAQRIVGRVQRKPSASRIIQRQCSCGGACEKCSAAATGVEAAPIFLSPSPRFIQAQAADSAGGAQPGAETEELIPRGGAGEPLDERTRLTMEGHFSRDLSDVRVHHDSESDKAAQNFNANAFTTGRDIYFAAGQYAPSTSEGRHLLAHELTHTIQQGSNGAMSMRHKLTVSEPRDADELEADAVADLVMRHDSDDQWKREEETSLMTLQRVSPVGAARQANESEKKLAHESMRIAQQRTGRGIQRQPGQPEAPNITKLRQLLRDDQENKAIEVMGQLSADEVRQTLASRELKDLAISAFNNDEMYRGIRAMRGDLYPSLEWMFDEGTDWEKAREVIALAPSGREDVRRDSRMKDQFVSICDDEEMAEAVDLLGGTLIQKLTWMEAEGSNWSLVKAKIQATTDESQKTDLYGNTAMRDFFVDVCDNKEMAEAVDLLGGTLLQKLQWMQEEGSDWSLVKAKLQATADTNQKMGLYGNTAMRDFFVDVCDNKEMAEAVDLLGGTLMQKLLWMKEEGSDWSLVKAKIQATADASQKTELYGNNAMLDFFVDVCNNEEMADAVYLLGGTLMQKLLWMKEEGSDWSLVKAKIQATTDANEKTGLYGFPAMLDFFVDVCDNKEMAEAVQLLGGELVQKLSWMLEEGTDLELVASVIRLTPPGELPGVLADKTVMDRLESELSKEDFERVRQMLSQGLLKWEEKKFSYEEKHYEQDKPGVWELKTFAETARYEIQYTRTELKIIVRIKLTGVTASPALRTTWINGIKNRWNNQFHIENDRRLAVLFEPIFTDVNAQHTIEVHDPPSTGVAREDSGNFYTTTTGDTAAHELYHLVGLEDEYNLTAADYTRLTGKPVPPGPVPASGYTEPGLAGTATGPVEGRHLRPFLDWLNSNRLPGEKPYRLVPGP